MDTPLVNGTAYPVLPVARGAYRFRILNACDDRYLNLQLYYADPDGLPRKRSYGPSAYPEERPGLPSAGRTTAGPATS